MLNSIINLNGIPYLILMAFLIATLGYLLGRITIKGIALGTSGVFVIALLFGMFFYPKLLEHVTNNVDSLLKVIENLGLVLFVTSVGFIAGPGFFANMQKHVRSYLQIGLVIVISGGLCSALCIIIGRALGELDQERFTALVAGLLSGALTSTPAFSVAKESAGSLYEDAVSAGYGIAYLFGVVGVVAFVQITPKLEKADMCKERTRLAATHVISEKTIENGLIQIEPLGIMPIATAITLGVLVGAIRIPTSSQGYEGATFSLTSTGGCLLISLLMGHFGKIGKISLLPKMNTLKVYRETGLMLFLIGAGVAGGSAFLSNFKPLYFFYGAFITLMPMMLGYFYAKKILRLELLDTLGAITGGMTSTPALGTLINTSGTDSVTAAYAAAYPIALVVLTMIEQLLILIF